MRAAIFNAAHEELTFGEVDISDPIGYEVLVRTAASGVCHSDLHFVDGLYPMRAPAVLGHEAAGVVEAVGPNVTEVAPGDHVIACLSVYCGSCENCLTGSTHLCENRPGRTEAEGPRLSMGGEAVQQMASIGSYAEQMLLHENGVVKVDKESAIARLESSNAEIARGDFLVSRNVRSPTVAIRRAQRNRGCYLFDCAIRGKLTDI